MGGYGTFNHAESYGIRTVSPSIVSSTVTLVQSIDRAHWSESLLDFRDLFHLDSWDFLNFWRTNPKGKIAKVCHELCLAFTVSLVLGDFVEVRVLGVFLSRIFFALNADFFALGGIPIYS